MGRRWDWGFGLDEVGTSSALLVSCSSGFSFYIISRNLSTPSVTGIYGNTAQFPPYGSSTAPAAAALRIMRYCPGTRKAPAFSGRGFRLSKKVCSPLGPLCEGAPPAGGGGENCTAVRNISGYGKVLSLRPFGAPPSQREVFRHAAGEQCSPLQEFFDSLTLFTNNV